MSRTKVNANLIDATFGNILEQIVYRADGRTITTRQGNITVPTSANQTTSDSTHTLASGSNIEYLPPAGATGVYYEFITQVDAVDTNGLYHFKVQLDNSSGTLTDITSSRTSYYAPEIRDFSFYIQEYIRIDGTENVANGQVGTWNTARTLQVSTRAYSGTYNGSINTLGNWDGSRPSTLAYPLIKITAYS
jgi:hypothetical protein